MWNKLVNDYLKLQDFPENTEKNYRVDLNQFIEFVEDNSYEPHTITTEEIAGYNEVLKAKGYKEATHNRKVVSLNRFLDYLKDIGMANENAKNIIPLKRNEKRESVFMNEEDVDSLLSYVENNRNSKEHKRDELLIKIMLGTGLRLDEVSRLDLKNLENGTLRIIGKGNKERKVPLPESLLKEIADYFLERENREVTQLFINKETEQPVSKSAIRQSIERIVKNVGLDKKGVTPHTFRHTYATMLASKGVPTPVIQSLLGHESQDITERYIHVTDKSKTNTADIISQLLFQ